MKTILMLFAMSLGAVPLLTAQITLRAGDTQTFPYGLIAPPPGDSCVRVNIGTPSWARVDLLLDGESMKGTGMFRMEIIAPNAGASSVWTGSNSPLSLSVSGYFNPYLSASVRLTGLTGEVVITRVALPWVTSEYNPVTRQYESCPLDGNPFVPYLHLTAHQIDSGQLRLRWTTNASGFRLVAMESLPAPAWIEVTNTLSTVGDYFEMTLPSLQAQRFFQLRKP